MKHIGGYQTRNLGAQAREGYDGTEQIVNGHIVRNYGGGGGLLMIGLGILTGGASLGGEALFGGLSAAGAEFGTAAAFDAFAAAETGIELATAIDTTANVLDAVDTVSEIADVASDVPFEADFPIDSSGLPSADIPADMPISEGDLPLDPNIDIPDMPINDGGLPPVNEGPMGPPAPETPPYDPNGLPDPTNPPYDPNGMPNTAPPNPSKPQKIPSQITSTIKKMLAPSPTQPTRTLGTSNQSALGVSCNQSTGFRMPNFLCNQADFLTNRGSGYKGGLDKLQQITGSGAMAPTSATPVCVYNMQDQMRMMGQAPIGSGLGYASGGSAADTWKQAFCEKNLKPEYVCDKPYLLGYQNTYQHRGLTPLKHIYPSTISSYADGGLQICGSICYSPSDKKKKKDRQSGGLSSMKSDAAFAAQQAQGEANSKSLANMGETVGNSIKSLLSQPPMFVQLMQSVLGPQGLGIGIGSMPGAPGTAAGYGGTATGGISGLGFTNNAPTGQTPADSGSGEAGMNAGQGGRGAPTGESVSNGEGTGMTGGNAGTGPGPGAGNAAGTPGVGANGYATGGLPHQYKAAAPKGHNPEFITGLTGYYACGGGTGQSDDIPAMLHDGDYVMDAETVSALGDGSSKAGKHVLDGFRTQIPHKAEGGSNPVPAKIADGEYVFPAAFVTTLGGGDNKRGAEILDGLRTKLRAHKRGAPLDKIPPKAKDPIDYIKKAKV